MNKYFKLNDAFMKKPWTKLPAQEPFARRIYYIENQ